MHRLKVWIIAVFGFSRTEANGFLILLPLMLVVLFSEPLYRNIWLRPKADPFQTSPELDSLVAQLKWPDVKSTKGEGKVRASVVPFTFFDPNTISEEGFVAFGLSPYLAGRVGRYRKQGGLFKNKTDLQKIYGMDSAWYKKAEPWIRIAAQPSKVRDQKKESPKISPERVDINSCDSVSLMVVRGIGPTLSRRIISFRDRLGGFHSLDQLHEVYGLDTAVLKSLERHFVVVPGFIPEKIKLNTALREDLERHPYIKRKEAQAIIAYRMQHGKFNSIQQLNELKILTVDWIQKMEPYLSLE